MNKQFLMKTAIFIILGVAIQTSAYGAEKDIRCRERIVEAVNKTRVRLNVDYEDVKVIEPFLHYIVHKIDPYISFTWDVKAGGTINGSGGDCVIEYIKME